MYKRIQGCTRVYWDVQEHTEIHVQEYTEMCNSILRCAIVHWDVQENTGMYKGIQGCTRVY